MLFKFTIILLFCYVYTALSVSTFFGDNKRAEYFEITDNEVPIVKVYLPENEFLAMKNEANKLTKDSLEGKINELFLDLTNKINVLKELNFIETFPGSNINEILPQLKIDNNGFASFDANEVLNGFDKNLESYEEDEFPQIDKHFYESNENFNINEIISTLNTLEVADGVDLEKIFNPSKNDDSVVEKKSKKKPNHEEEEKFKTKNATITIDINGEIKTFNETTFSLGGLFSRLFAKPGYNINIRGKNILYGRKQYKIRSDGQDPTFLRIKLLSDIRNRLGFPSVSANFVQLYINDQYMGFYVISDAYKKSWIEYIYGEKNTTTLYQCNTLRNLTLSGKDGCTNENDEVSDHSEWESFLSQVENAKSPEDLEDIFEIDHFMKEMALDYITGSMDHLIKGHNFYFYKQPNGKWIYLSYDFDLDFGIFFDDLLQTSYTEFFGNNVNLINTLIFKDPQRFEKALNEIVQSTMNPATLFPHIDELKQFIKPYVKLEKIPDANGRLPGRLNKQSIGESYSFEQWDAFTEFTSDIFSVSGYTYGLKYWILMKYRLVCNNYGIEGDPIYLDENYEYSVNEELNFANKGMIVENPFHIGENNNENNKNKLSSESFKPDDTLDIISSNSTVIAEDPSKKAIKCLAELIGYTCCSDGITIVYDHDEYGDWSYDVNEHIWCGLTPYEEPSTPVDDDCWSKELGYSCCKGCKVYETDGSGSWGYELDQWCGIPTSCQTN